MSQDYKANLTRSSIWMRLIYMIIFAVAFNVAEIVIFIVTIFQFLASLFTGEPNDRLVRFGRNLAKYIHQVIAFLTFATEERPFPFSSWPDEPDSDTPTNDPIIVQPEKTPAEEKQTEASTTTKPRKRTTRKSPTGPKTRKKPG